MQEAHFDKLYTVAHEAVEVQRQRILSSGDMRADADVAAVPLPPPPVPPRFWSRTWT
ncbi:MAG: hypothetical protein JWO26_659 [Rhodospirillales bacterium]|jgi:hypothetical protein|nr:hypothetical protein [Rhodospirillales bacterium]MDB5381027.1 hypothetical protein [Rhodospirillales bacterium]